MALNPGDRLGAFELVAPLGHGAMGEVYRALDTKLGREVAVKLLPSHFAQQEERLARFQREARLLASLNHPGIAHLHQLDESEGTHFLVMELVEGATLEERLTHGPLEVGEALGFFAQIAEGIEAAHEKDIIHRDLKPANIKITPGGQVKILDFGLAKAFQSGVSESGQLETLGYDSSPTDLVSQAGQRIGTPAYMSPEQARGKVCDTAADIWAFGVCFYEALTGDRPFRGGTSSDVMAEILKSEPDWNALPEATPAHIRSLLRRCLEKDPTRRPRHIGDLAITLQDTVTDVGSRTMSASTFGSSPTSGTAPSRANAIFLGGAIGAAILAMIFFAVARNRSSPPPAPSPPIAAVPASPATVRSMVVLPFVNIVGDADQDYFVEGMRDALSAELSKIGIRTISRSSAMRYKNSKMTSSEIAKELNVDALIEGSVQRVGDDIRIMAELVHGQSAEPLWAANYHDTFENVLDLQGRLALEIAREVQLTITPEKEKRLAAARPVDTELYELYMKGVYHRQRWTRDSAYKAITYFERALELDPDYALAHLGLAETYVTMADYYFPPYEVMPLAKKAALRAVEIDETLTDAHVTLGWVHLFYEYAWKDAEKEFTRALELDPGSSRAHIGYALYLTSMLHSEEALAEVRQALELDPFPTRSMNWIGMVLYMGRHFGPLLEILERVTAVAPEIFPAYAWMGLGQAAIEDYPAAIESLEKAVELDANSLNIAFLGNTLALAGQPEKAREAFPQFDAIREEGHYVCPYEVATVYIGLEEFDKAFEWLEIAYDIRSDCIPWLRADIRLDPVRSDPRFAKILEKVDFPGP